MMSPPRFAVVVMTLALTIQHRAFADVTAERSERGAVVQIDGELFTEYLTKAGQAPAMWPIIGPTGQEMTRSYPLGPARPGETDDHPHHPSLWVAHDQVNGADFWQENVESRGRRQGPHIVHQAFDELESLGSTARIVTRNDWMNGTKRVCQDERIVVYGTRPNGDRWIDFTIVIKATDGDVTFGDTKEGTFAIRVADSMRLKANPGGRVINSEGLIDDEAWGLPARWVDYSGPIDGEIVGVAMMSHPSSFRPVPRWHVRDYGLFTANPFGERDFPESKQAQQGAVTIKQGDDLTLRYRVLLHRGDAKAADLEDAFNEFAVE